MRHALTILSLAFALAACTTDARLAGTRQAVTAESACAGLDECTADSVCTTAHEAAAPALAPATAGTGEAPPKTQPLACSSCHSSWTPNCMTCHMDFDVAQTIGDPLPVAPAGAPGTSPFLR
jgi:hypothetical protein